MLLKDDLPPAEIIFLTDKEVDDELRYMIQYEVYTILIHSKLGNSVIARKFKEGRIYCRMCKQRFTEETIEDKIRHVRHHFEDDFRATEAEIESYIT